MIESIGGTAIEDMVNLGTDIAKEKYQNRTDIHKLKIVQKGLAKKQSARE